MQILSVRVDLVEALKHLIQVTWCNECVIDVGGRGVAMLVLLDAFCVFLAAPQQHVHDFLFFTLGCFKWTKTGGKPCQINIISEMRNWNVRNAPAETFCVMELHSFWIPQNGANAGTRDQNHLETNFRINVEDQNLYIINSCCGGRRSVKILPTKYLITRSIMFFV